MDLDSIGKEKEVKYIINCLDWKEFFKKLDEGVLQLIEEFYANRNERVDDKVYAKGIWINMSSETINNLIGALDHEEDRYSLVMDERVDTIELVTSLCQADKEVI